MALYKHKTEKNTREREQWLSTTLRSIADAVVTTNAEGQVTFLNAVAEALSGWTLELSCGRPYGEVFAIIDETTRQSKSSVVSSALAEGVTLTHANHTLLLARDGSERHIEYSVAPIRQDNSPVTGCVIVFSDVSARRQLEAELRQSQKMESIGKLAGSIAHDFNNAITAVMGYSSLLLSRLPLGSTLHDDAGQILRAAEHSARLTRQLLAFSRKQVLHPVCLDLGVAVREMQGLLRRLIHENIALTIAAEEPLWGIKADPGNIEQLVLNMAVNARDAMPDGGQLHISLTNAALSPEVAEAMLGARAGEFVCLKVADTGTGMSQDLIERIFEPFFTTKGLDKGTGLGLSTCDGIVRQTEGFISVASEMGEGTVFSIYFPRTTAPLFAEAAPDMESGHSLSGCGTILLVEDEEAVRMLAARVLEELGYTVLEAGDGYAALKLLSERKVAVDLIITDLVMPELSGRELIERISAVHGAPKVLYMSGYTDDDLIKVGVFEEEIAFLQKPFTPDILARKVRETLSQAQPMEAGLG